LIYPSSDLPIIRFTHRPVIVVEYSILLDDIGYMAKAILGDCYSLFEGGEIWD